MEHGFLETNDSRGVTPVDEVKSKYFTSNEIVERSQTHTLGSGRSSIPEETRKILKEMDLPSDFLSSDSSLSDSLSESELEDDSFFFPTPRPSPIRLEPPIPSPVSKTPTKRAAFTAKIPQTPRPKVLKKSPYFPKLSTDQESCLPFPPIDAPSFGLIQEQLAHEPFKLLLATIFLNRTRGGVALPVLFKVFARYPTIDAMATADLSELVSMIHCLGFQNQRAKKCISIARFWQTHPPVKGKRYRKLHYPSVLDGRDIGRHECVDDEDHRSAWEIAHLPGLGAYSLDSWRIFCRDELRDLADDWKGNGATTKGFVPEWKSVLPQDKELRAYLTWMWLKEGWIWDRHTGDLTPASEKMLRAAQKGGVAHEADGNWILEMSPVKAANGLHEED